MLVWGLAYNARQALGTVGFFYTAMTQVPEQPRKKSIFHNLAESQSLA